MTIFDLIHLFVESLLYLSILEYILLSLAVTSFVLGSVHGLVWGLPTRQTITLGSIIFTPFLVSWFIGGAINWFFEVRPFAYKPFKRKK